LALTSTMMSISVPVINAGLARAPDPASQLAAFGLAFSLSIFLESPVFALQQAVVAWFRGGSVRPLVVFSALVGLVMSGVMLVVGFTSLGETAFRSMLGTPPELVGPALRALQVAAFFPPLVAVRSAYQGILVLRGNSAPMAWGTFVRMVCLGGLVAWICPLLPLEPPAAAMAALVVAVVLETLYVGWAAATTPDRAVEASPAHHTGRGVRERLRFLAPLALTTLLGSLTNPLIQAFISRTADPQNALAVYAVMSSLVWFLASSSLRYSSVVIALGTTEERRRRLVSFLWRFVGTSSAIAFLLILTPARHLLIDRLLGLPPELAARVYLPLGFLALQPLVAAFIAYYQGVFTRNAQVLAVGAGSVARLVAILSLGWVGLSLSVRGEMLGGVLLGASFMAELGALLLFGRRGSPVRSGSDSTPRDGV
jgi:hypothetical protein